MFTLVPDHFATELEHKIHTNTVFPVPTQEMAHLLLSMLKLQVNCQFLPVTFLRAELLNNLVCNLPLCNFFPLTCPTSYMTSFWLSAYVLRL